MTAAFVAAVAVATKSADPRGWLWSALALFVVAGITDAADGWLARRWNAISVFGRVVDPLADKVLILGAFIMLADLPGSPIEPWMAVVVLTRELLVTGLRGALEGKGIDFSAGPTGKIKMVLQWLLLVAVLADFASDRTEEFNAWQPLVWATWATVAFTAYSGWPYVRRALSPPTAT